MDVGPLPLGRVRMIPTIEKLTWWVQLVDSTTIDNWTEAKRLLELCCANNPCVAGIDWDGPLPAVIDIFGWGVPMDMESMLYEIREHLKSGEYIVLVEMVREDVFDSNSLKYYIMTDETYLVADGKKALNKELLKMLASD